MPSTRPLRRLAPLVSAAALALSAAACTDRANPLGPAPTPPVTTPGSVVFLMMGVTRNWTGAVSTDWNVGTNWSGGVVPTAPDSVVIPTGVPNFPVLTSNVTVAGVTVADLATLDLGAFNLTATNNVGTGPTAGSGILASSGTVFLAGVAGTVHGRLPRATVTGTYSLDGAYWGIAPETVTGGRLTVTNFEMIIG